MVMNELSTDNILVRWEAVGQGKYQEVFFSWIEWMRMWKMVLNLKLSGELCWDWNKGLSYCCSHHWRGRRHRRIDGQIVFRIIMISSFSAGHTSTFLFFMSIVTVWRYEPGGQQHPAGQCTCLGWGREEWYHCWQDPSEARLRSPQDPHHQESLGNDLQCAHPNEGFYLLLLYLNVEFCVAFFILKKIIVNIRDASGVV